MTRDSSACGFSWLGWILAVVATGVAIYLYQRTPTTPAAPTLAEQLETFKATNPDDVTQMQIEAHENEDGIRPSGTIFWNAKTNAGFLVVRDLPKNHPLHQYQLWAFDSAFAPDSSPTAGPYPIDAAIFDSPGPEEFIVPFKPRNQVVYGAGFMITRERAGGVVVSRRQNLLATAERSDPEEKDSSSRTSDQSARQKGGKGKAVDAETDSPPKDSADKDAPQDKGPGDAPKDAPGDDESKKADESKKEPDDAAKDSGKPGDDAEKSKSKDDDESKPKDDGDKSDGR